MKTSLLLPVTLVFGMLLIVSVAWLGYRHATVDTRSESVDATSARAKDAAPSPDLARTQLDEPRSFMGLRFGEDIRQQVPECPRSWWEVKVPCRKDIVDSLHEIHNLYVGDRSLGEVLASQVSDKLEKVSITFSSDRYPEMLAMFSERYGKPKSTAVEQWRSKAGATFTNNTASWKWRSLEISIDERGLKVDEGMAIYTTAAWRAAQNAERERNVKAAAKTL